MRPSNILAVACLLSACSSSPEVRSETVVPASTQPLQAGTATSTQTGKETTQEKQIAPPVRENPTQPTQPSATGADEAAPAKPFQIPASPKVETNDATLEERKKLETKVNEGLATEEEQKRLAELRAREAAELAVKVANNRATPEEKARLEALLKSK